MIFKNYINKISDFIIRRLAELVGIFLVVISILLFISLISYSPDDPNFIFPENQEIKNLLGFRGSLIADIFFQSIGLVSYLVSLTLIFTGITGVLISILKSVLLVVRPLRLASNCVYPE